MPVEAEEFKAAMSAWATGVTIVTSRAGDRVHGMTVSDFCGVSLEPPLVLVCADKSSNTLEVIEKGRVFAVNVLAAHQDALSNRFASRREEHRRFEGLDWTQLATGAPVLPGAAATFDCRLEAAHDAGDHVIYVGRVESVAVRDAAPLVYYGGRYGDLAPRS